MKVYVDMLPEKCKECALLQIHHSTNECFMYSNGIPSRYNIDINTKPDWCELELRDSNKK